MSVYDFDHTKRLLLEEVRIKTDSLSAALMSQSYIYDSGQTSFYNMEALEIESVSAILTTTYANGIYRAYLDQLFFEDINEIVGSVIIHADGYKGGIDRPVLFVCQFSESDLNHSDLIFNWSVPLLKW